MRHHSSLRKILSLVVIAALLSLRLSSLTEEVFVIPVEDTIFDVAFIAAEDGAAEGKLIKVKLKRAFDIVILAPGVELLHHGASPQLARPCAVALLNLKDIHSEIFIPPETIS